MKDLDQRNRRFKFYPPDDTLLVSKRKLYPVIAFAPLIVTTIFFSFLGETPTNGNSDTSSAIVGSDDPTDNKTSEIPYLVSIQSGYGGKTIFERKASFGAFGWTFGWGDNGVPINGTITTVPPNMTSLENRIISVQAEQNQQLVYEKIMRTDKNGKFDTSFFPPESGNVKVTTALINPNSTTAKGVLTIIVTESGAPVIIIGILIGAAIALIVGTWARHGNKAKLTKTDKLFLKLSLVPVGILTLSAFVVLYRFPPFDAAGNAAFATAMIAPIAAYVYEAIVKD